MHTYLYKFTMIFRHVTREIFYIIMGIMSYCIVQAHPIDMMVVVIATGLAYWFS